MQFQLFKSLENHRSSLSDQSSGLIRLKEEPQIEILGESECSSLIANGTSWGLGGALQKLETRFNRGLNECLLGHLSETENDNER